MRNINQLLIGVAVLLIGLPAVTGCGYGKVSPTTYELATSLYNISNRKLSDKLDESKAKIAEALENGDISSKEADWLNAIIDRAEKQQWKKAMNSARRIMEDQATSVSRKSAQLAI